MAFGPYLGHMSPSMGLVPELLPSGPVLVPGSPTGITMGNGNSAQKPARTDKLEVLQCSKQAGRRAGKADGLLCVRLGGSRCAEAALSLPCSLQIGHICARMRLGQRHGPSQAGSLQSALPPSAINITAALQGLRLLK